MIEVGLNDSTNQKAAQIKPNGMFVSSGQSSKLPRQMKIVMFYETLRYIFIHESRLAGRPSTHRLMMNVSRTVRSEERVG